MPIEQNGSLSKKLKKATGGAVGAGLVLVVLPCIGLVAGMHEISRIPAVGLPILAIFGIMILFGALALTSTLFARLSLADPAEALALPPGSIRAAIALALIVLFAIIAIMLYQSVSEPYRITGLTEADKTIVLRDLANRVIAVRPEPCPGGVTGCVPHFEVHVVQPRGQESTDLAKQLLILVGTLMTSVTSFYFAARTGAAPKEQAPPDEVQPAANEGAA
jgi:hypothetical protein